MTLSTTAVATLTAATAVVVVVTAMPILVGAVTATALVVALAAMVLGLAVGVLGLSLSAPLYPVVAYQVSASDLVDAADRVSDMPVVTYSGYVTDDPATRAAAASALAWCRAADAKRGLPVATPEYAPIQWTIAPLTVDAPAVPCDVEAAQAYLEAVAVEAVTTEPTDPAKAPRKSAAPRKPAPRTKATESDADHQARLALRRQKDAARRAAAKVAV